MFNLLKDVLPEDSAEQSSAEKMTKECLAELKISEGTFLDLGCGDGKAVDFLKSNFPHMSYLGIDIDGSPESSSRTRDDAKFLTYDGIHLPFEDESIEVIYSKQVFEHVRYPHLLLPEIHRVLKMGGCLLDLSLN